MKSYTIAGIEVHCFESIKDAEQWSCKFRLENSRYINSTTNFEMHYVAYEPNLASPFIQDEINPSNNPSDFSMIEKKVVKLTTYTDNLSYYKDFYNCFLTEKVEQIQISRDIFCDLHDLIRGQFIGLNRDSMYHMQDFENNQYYKIAGTIAELRDIISYKSFYVKDLKLFSVRNEIIAFTDKPIIRSTVELHDHSTQSSAKAWAYFMERPSFCLRMKIAPDSESEKMDEE